MRIRKNAKLSTILQFSAPEWRLQTLVCQLNRSPWDVIDFSEDTYPVPSLNQFGGNDSFDVNTSLGDFAGAVESVESMMDCEDDKTMEMETRNDNGGEEDDEATKIRKKKLCKGLNNKTNVSTKRGAAMTRPGRARKGSSCNSSNPYEFYYYSGFGPSWGKRRANRNGDGGGGEAKIKRKPTKSKDVEGVITQNTTPPSLIDRSEELDFVEEEYDCEEEDDDEQISSNNGGKKRVRKLVKARSLKSLM